jgi:N-acetylglucosamine kinase-like BadF-type ATPase
MKCDEDTGRANARQELGKAPHTLKYSFLMQIFMGLDGGGTKTDCVLMDQSGHLLARTRGGPSNPSRIGVEAAALAVKSAASQCLKNGSLRMQQVAGVCAGLAGVALPERAEKMRTELAQFFHPAAFDLCTDLDLALGAAGLPPAIALVAGTGSAAIGRDSSGRIARSGGYGPKSSDEGSAFAIGKNAIAAAIAEPELASNLLAQIRTELDGRSPNELAKLDGVQADQIYPRMFSVVVNVAEQGDSFARNILTEAARNLAALVSEVQQQLGLDGRAFTIAKIGGMLGRSPFFDAQLDAALHAATPSAVITTVSTPLAEIAARRALNATT